jgi:hypothetical protein
MATTDMTRLTKEQIEQLTKISKNLESNEMWKQDDAFYEGDNYRKGGILPNPSEVVYGPVKIDDTLRDGTDDFLSAVKKKNIKEFMEKNFPGLTVKQVKDLCKEKFPENYI